MTDFPYPTRPPPALILPLEFIAVFATLARPANMTPYTAGDSISNHATAGSVLPLVATVADIADMPLKAESLKLVTTDTGLGGKSVRAWFYNSDPTASTGVGAGDNVAFSNKLAGLVGTMSGTMRAMSDGAVGILVPDEGWPIRCLPGSGTRSLWVQYQTLSDFTPSANSTTLIGTLRGEQARA